MQNQFWLYFIQNTEILRISPMQFLTYTVQFVFLLASAYGVAWQTLYQRTGDEQVLNNEKF